MIPTDILGIGKFFDFTAHPFEHEKLFRREGVATVVDVLDHIGPYCHDMFNQFPADYSAEYDVAHSEWPSTACEGAFNVVMGPDATFSPDRIIGGKEPKFIFVDENAVIQGGTFDVTAGSIYLGPRTCVQGSWIAGPCMVGGGTHVRPGAYLRGDVIVGRQCVIRGEIKNSVVMDEGEFPHPCYLGDSVCGYKCHFGNQVTAANVNIFGRKEPLSLKTGRTTIPLGRRKIGIVMGDYCQVGCNAVSDPATFLLPHTIVYSLTRINSGIYGPNEVLKNKPMEHGVIERVPLA